MPILIFASLAIRELGRRRVIAAVAALTALCVALTGWAFYKLHGYALAHSATITRGDEAMANAMQVILLAHMFGMVLAVGAAFLAAPAIANEIEGGVALAILPRPIRRLDVVLGKFLGLAAVTVAFVFVTGAVEFAVVDALTGYLPPHPVQALAYISAGAVVLLALSLAGSTRFSPIAVGIVAVALYGVAWIGQVADAVAAAYHNDAIRTACTIISLLVPSGGMWRGAIFSLEPTLLAAASAQVGVNPITVTSPPTPAYLIWTAAWVVVVLAVAVATFERRDV
ncbi:MAG TPA: ABC transporter permease subunit [Candidatus Eremiobacteraceae bacterium]|nr:ABC transporter permease subunit [Candidatus Eremiobacteraceae bacterium]